MPEKMGIFVAIKQVPYYLSVCSGCYRKVYKQLGFSQVLVPIAIGRYTSILRHFIHYGICIHFILL